MITGSRWKYALAVWLGLGSVNVLRAADPPPKQERTPPREAWQKMSPEERQTKAREMREKLEKLTPDQREAQRKVLRGRIEKRVEELKKKKADGAITEREAKLLDQWQQRLKRWDQRAKPAPPADQPGDKHDETT
ncbi:MAG: hypothetical protein NTW03_01020 [Verrucomicrobia bacterium]|nr:hypothetical protein [Verrucomicrobiota bacterium]